MYFISTPWSKWILSTVSCILIGLTGIFPFFIFRPKQILDKIQLDDPPSVPINTEYIDLKKLNRLLSFAIGSLLGDAFLHLLPEAWERSRIGYSSTNSSISQHQTLILMGLWILIGIISFVICEKLMNLDETILNSSTISNNNIKLHSSVTNECEHEETEDQSHTKKPITTGYLNLLANIFDNFTHGLAIGQSYIVSTKVGILTTLAILLHEIPHEIADFSILLRSGFKPLDAVKAQLSTSTVGILGAFFALIANTIQEELGNLTWWILPYTAGCFITISMTNLLPDLLIEKNTSESLKQIGFLIAGIFLMGILASFHI